MNELVNEFAAITNFNDANLISVEQIQYNNLLLWLLTKTFGSQRHSYGTQDGRVYVIVNLFEPSLTYIGENHSGFGQ